MCTHKIHCSQWKYTVIVCKLLMMSGTLSKSITTCTCKTHEKVNKSIWLHRNNQNLE